MTNDEQCTASSWRDVSHKPYGPGNYNRCCGPKNGHVVHVDAFGNVFTVKPNRVIGHTAVAEIRVHSTTEFAKLLSETQYR